MDTYYPLKSLMVILHHVGLFYKSSGIVHCLLYSIVIHPFLTWFRHLKICLDIYLVSVIPILMPHTDSSSPTELLGVGRALNVAHKMCMCFRERVGGMRQPTKQTNLKPTALTPIIRNPPVIDCLRRWECKGEKSSISPLGSINEPVSRGPGRQSARKLYIYFTNAKALEIFTLQPL